jgi:hypothetical protein
MLKIIWRKAKGFFAHQKKIHKIVAEFQKIELQMKKLFAPVALMATLLVVSCGPSAEEKAAAAQREADSIAAADAAMKAAEEAAMAAMAADTAAAVDSSATTDSTTAK